MMLYTSGTTGKPKGVRRRLLDLTPEDLYPILMRKSWRHFGLPEGGVHLVASQLYHSAPYGQAMMALQLGHSIIAPERFDAAETLRADRAAPGDQHVHGADHVPPAAGRYRIGITTCPR